MPPEGLTLAKVLTVNRQPQTVASSRPTQLSV